MYEGRANQLSILNNNPRLVFFIEEYFAISIYIVSPL